MSNRRISRDTVQRIIDTVQHAPKKPIPSSYSVRDAVQKLAPYIQEMQQKGYDHDEVVSILDEYLGADATLFWATLSTYRADKSKAVTKPQPTAKDKKKLEPIKAQVQSTSSSKQEGHFALKPDTSDL